MKKKNKENKKNRKLNFYKIIGIILMLSSIVLLAMVLYVNILPMKYLSILLGGLVLINIIFNFFLFRKRVKKKPKKIITVLSILFSILFLVGSYFIYKTFGVLDDMSQQYKTYTYHVVVKNDSSYEEIEDIASKTLGYYNDNSEASKKSLEKLGKVVTTTNESYGNLEGLGTSVLNGETDAIVVEDTNKKMLDTSGNNETSENALSGFSGKTRVIYTFKVKAKVESKEVDVTKDVFNVYISGMDQYGEVLETSLSDVNMILTINPKTKQILMTNIPRDYFVQLHDTTGYKDKLTHAGTYGIDTSIKTIEDLMGIEINYYFKVNFSSLQKIVDALGGVEVYSEYSFQTYNGYNFTKGYNSVDGTEALFFVRERKAFNDGDNQRGKNQQAMIEAIFRKCTSPSIITRYSSLLNSLQDSILTNMPTKSMTSLAKMQLKDSAKWTITSQSVKGTGSYEYTYTYPYQELYVMVPDEESVTEAKKQIDKVASGEILESSYDDTSSNVHSVTKSQVSSSSSSSSSSTSSSTKKQNVNSTNKNTTVKKPSASTKTCPSGQELDKASNKCVPVCGSGYQLNDNKTSCVPICGDGYHLDGNNTCVADEPPTPCDEGFHLDENNNCVADDDPVINQPNN